MATVEGTCFTVCGWDVFHIRKGRKEGLCQEGLSTSMFIERVKASYSSSRMNECSIKELSAVGLVHLEDSAGFLRQSWTHAPTCLL